jgi:ubiquinone/menaquinone biosynthesis C-methylase UbiE
MANDTANEILAAWETSSHYWSKHQLLIEKMFATLSRALIEDAQIRLAQSVLDVGGGSGEPSLTIAPIVGDLGQVTYTDPSAGMVKAARDEAGRRGIRNIQFHQCPAQQLPFEKNSFDASISRLSVMFFPDVIAGLREMLRVTKPEGRLSFVVWASRDANPFFTVVTEVLDKFVAAEVEDEDAPGAFRFATPGKLSRLLQEAGAIAVAERALRFGIEAPITAASFWELRSEMSDTFRNKLKNLSTAQAAAVKTEVEKAVAPYFEHGEMNFPGAVLVITGRKPGS